MRPAQSAHAQLSISRARNLARNVGACSGVYKARHALARSPDDECGMRRRQNQPAVGDSCEGSYRAVGLAKTP